jgi:hypothetical protein
MLGRWCVLSKPINLQHAGPNFSFQAIVNKKRLPFWSLGIYTVFYSKTRQYFCVKALGGKPADPRTCKAFHLS